jgi:CRP/FNR family transcriptional regulator
VCVLPFDQLDRLAQELPSLRHNLYRFISKDICRDQDMMFLLGSRCAEERLVLYLINLAARYRIRGYSPSEFVLRMTRKEIASYLGLKLETVSRLFSHLQEEGLIQVQGRAVKLLDLIALNKLVVHVD